MSVEGKKRVVTRDWTCSGEDSKHETVQVVVEYPAGVKWEADRPW